METGRMKLALSAGALALSMALVGCGGGGSSSGTPQPTVAQPTIPPVVPPTPPTSAAETFSVGGVPAEGNERPSNWSVMAGMIKAGETATLGSLSITCPSGDEDCDITVDGTSIKSSVEDTTAVLTEAAKMQVAEDSKDRTRSAEEADRRAQGVFSNLSDAQTGSPPAVKVSREMDGDAKITIAGYSADKDATPHAIDGWAGAILKDQNIPQAPNPITDLRAVVYSNIGKPEKVLFANVYGANPQHKTVARANWFGGASNVVSYNRATRTLQIAADGASDYEVDVSAGRFKAKDYFPPKGGPEWSYGNHEDDEVDRREFPGTFHGADGTYRCDETATATDTCTVSVASDGHFFFTGEWVFTHGTSSQAEIIDVDHLHFGYWISTPMDAEADGTYDYEVNLIANGNQAFLAADIPASGTATYEGNAAGVYAVRAGIEGQAPTTSWGEFVADASLTANWGSIGTTADESARLQGQITNFQSADGNNVNMDGWRVDLREDFLDNAAGIPVIAESNISNASAFMGAGNASSRATWAAAFYGPGRNNADNTTDLTTAPTGVAGTFEADFANGRIDGAFAATPPPAE